MKIQLAALAAITVLILSVTVVDSAFAQKPTKNVIDSIAEKYSKAITKAQNDFTAAVKRQMPTHVTPSQRAFQLTRLMQIQRN